MKKISYFALLSISIFLFVIHASFAQFGQLETGARSQGMGRTSLTFQDANAVFNNIATLAELQQPEAFANYTNRFALAPLHTLSAGIAFPTFYDGVGAFGMMRFGNELYNEQRLILGYSHKISNYSIGIGLNYLQVSIQNYGTRGVFALEMGGKAQLSQKLFLGMHIFNINSAVLSDLEDERLPTLMRIGLSYRPLPTIKLNVETEKDIDTPASFKAGVEYEIVPEQIYARTGITTNPFVGSFGVGYHYKELGFDYALTQLPVLGFSNHLSITYKIKKRHDKRSKGKAE